MMATVNGGKAVAMGASVAIVSAVAVAASFILPESTPAPSLITPQSASAEELTPFEPAATNTVEASISGWIPYWDAEDALDTLRQTPENVSEVSPFWYDITTQDGRTAVTSRPISGGSSRQAVTQELKDMGFLVLPTITDSTAPGVLSKSLSTSKKRIRLAQDIISLVKTNQYDGVDLNWENFGFSDGSETWTKTRKRWVDFVSLLSKRLDKQNAILAVTTPVMTSSTDGYWVYDWKSIAPHVDRLRIMAYDYSFTYPGAVGPIWWAEKALQYATSVSDPEKIQLGVASYGRNWVTEISGLCPSSAPVGRTTVSPQTASRLAKETKSTVQWDPESAESTFTYKRTYREGTLKCTVSREVWFPSTKSLRARFDLAEQYNTQGVAVWTFGDTPRQFLARP